MTLASDLKGAAEVLGELGATWCVVGGVAVSAYVQARFTVDVDLVVACADDAESEAVVRAFHAKGWLPTDVIEQEATGRLATVRLQSPRGSVVDLLFATCGVEALVVEAATVIEVLPHLYAPTARAGHLVAMKVLSADDERPRDVQDLVALVRNLSEEDRHLARAAAEAMMRAGSHRQRDLPALLEPWLARHPPAP